MFTYQCQLKQHTPLIHFQNEPGATLRATELKPKLDKFLLEKVGIREEWKVSGKEEALDYKVRIKTVREKPVPIDGFKIPFFFADLGTEESGEHKYLSFTEHAITIRFASFHESLLELIESHLSEFLMSVNYGTRQSKGFGSFSMPDAKWPKEHLAFRLKLNVDDPVNDNLFEKNKIRIVESNVKQWIRLMGQIELFYKSLRSGINRIGGGGVKMFYIKPAIFHYAKDVLNAQWDKRSIKGAYLQRELDEQVSRHRRTDILTYSTDPKERHHLMVKELFGLSSSETWQSYGKATVTRAHEYEGRKENEIQRFKSPVFFKPIRLDNRHFEVGVYFLPVNQEFLNEVFQVQFKGRRGLKLKTPTAFSWPDFIKYLIHRIPTLEERSASQKDIRRQAEFRILTDLHTQINEQST